MQRTPRTRFDRQPRLLQIVAAVGALVVALLVIQPSSVASASTVSITGHVALGNASTAAGANTVAVYAAPLTGDYPSPNGTSVDANGNFSISYLRPGVAYYLWYQYFGAGKFSDQWSNNKSASTDLIPSDAVTVSATTTVVAPTMVLPPDATFSGHVDGGTLGNSVGAGDVTLSFTYSDPIDILNLGVFDHSHTATTDANGNYSIALPAGLWKVDFTSNNPAWYSTLGVPVHMGTDNQTVNQILPIAGTVNGHVSVGNSAIPAGAGQVQVSYDFDPITPGAEQNNVAHTLTDSQGNYRFTDLAMGTYAFHFTAVDGSNYQTTIVQQIVKIDGPAQTKTAPNVTLPVGTVIAGTVTLGTTAVKAKAGEVSVALYSEGSLFAPLETTTTDANGHYAFPGLASGPYLVDLNYVGTAGYASSWWTPVQDSSHPYAILQTEATLLTAAGAPLDASETLPPGTTVSGRLTSSSGGVPPQVAVITINRLDSAGAIIDTLSSGSDGNQFLTKADGTYSVGPLVPGRYQLTFVTLGYSAAHAGSSVANPSENDVITATSGKQTGVNATQFLNSVIHLTVTCPNCRPGIVFDYVLNVQQETAAGWTDVPQTVYGLDAYWYVGLYPGNYRITYTSTKPPFDQTVEDVTLTEGERYTDTDQLNPPRILPSVPGGLGDFDGDGNPDIVARDASGTLWLYPTQRLNGLLPRVSLGGGWQSMTSIAAVGDFDGDGNPDIVARDSAGTVWLYPGNGSNGFKPRVQLATGWQSMTAIEGVGDFDDDGFRDLAVRDKFGQLWLYPGNGSGGLGARKFISSALSKMTSIVGVGDFDGDWEADLLAVDPDGVLWLYPGNGDGTLGDPVEVGDDWDGVQLAGMGDFLDDDNQDILALDAFGDLAVYGDGNPYSLSDSFTGLRLVGDGTTSPTPNFHNLPAPMIAPHVGGASTPVVKAPTFDESSLFETITPTDLATVRQATQLEPRIASHRP